MKEQWIRWMPEKDISGIINLETLIIDNNGLKLILKNEDNGSFIQILFESLVLSLRCTDEGRRIKTLNDLGKKYGAEFWGKWKFFKVIDSDYVRWHNIETYDIYAEYDINHYVIFTTDDIIEVLTDCDPVVHSYCN